MRGGTRIVHSVRRGGSMSSGQTRRWTGGGDGGAVRRGAGGGACCRGTAGRSGRIRLPRPGRGVVRCRRRLRGWGLSLRGGYLANRYVMTGFGLETARLHAEGTVPVFGGAFVRRFQSTLAAALSGATTHAFRDTVRGARARLHGDSWQGRSRHGVQGEQAPWAEARPLAWRGTCFRFSASELRAGVRTPGSGSAMKLEGRGIVRTPLR